MLKNKVILEKEIELHYDFDTDATYDEDLIYSNLNEDLYDIITDESNVSEFLDYYNSNSTEYKILEIEDASVEGDSMFITLIIDNNITDKTEFANALDELFYDITSQLSSVIIPVSGSSYKPNFNLNGYYETEEDYEIEGEVSLDLSLKTCKVKEVKEVE